MAIPADHPLARTLAFRDSRTALDAIRAVAGELDAVTRDGLVEVIYQPANARTALAALNKISNHDSPLLLDVWGRAISPHSSSSVRMRALQRMTEEAVCVYRQQILFILAQDESWMLRRDALRTLRSHSQSPGQLLIAASDPHWRVRHELALCLLEKCQSSIERKDVEQALAAIANKSPAAAGLLAYVKSRWNAEVNTPPEESIPQPADPRVWCKLWDWDPAVMLRKLQLDANRSVSSLLTKMPRLAGHDDERIRKFALDQLHQFGTPTLWAQSLVHLDEPRHQSRATLLEHLDTMDLDQVEDIMATILEQPDQFSMSAVQWAVDQVGEIIPEEDYRTELLRANRILSNAPTSPSLGVQLPIPDAPLHPTHPYSRAARLTVDDAQRILGNPTQETSWHVLEAACRLCKKPLWELHPPHTNRLEPLVTTPLLELQRPIPTVTTLLGSPELLVSRMGISGHYGLPVTGFQTAYESGINLMFWEPNYATMREFFERITTSDRAAIHLVAGTFEADPRQIRRDIERALRILKVDCLALFLLFWMRSWERLSDEVRRLLEQLQVEGKTRLCSLSTHSRPLAIEAINEGWNPIMVRHSAAHRGAESQVLPLAREKGASVITFNSTCYGRLLRNCHGSAAVAAADCYRYTLNTPGVSACWSAPANMEQLRENLTAVEDLAISPDRRQSLLKHGEVVYREDKTFERCLRAL